MSNRIIEAAIAALPDSNTRGMPEAEKALVASAWAAVALAEQARIANRIAVLAARPGLQGPDSRAALDRISDELE